ncbi:MAG: hypothetical protein KAI24_05895 [Planctomycetes bacterium]|nr:hypothetical protein [Planctomycetota bacterium]
MSATANALTLAALGVTTCVAAWSLQAPARPATPENPPTAAAADRATAPPRPAAAAFDRRPEQVAQPSDRRRQLLLPDGSYVPALNDAVDAAPLHEYWGPRPWSPIVAVERSGAGVDWYRHANGSYSTTQMVMRPDLGRMAAMTRVAHVGQAPAAPAPAATRDGPR